MAKNDYYVIAYRILAYLYLCMKEGEIPDVQLIGFEVIDIPERYWNQVMGYLLTDEYITGVHMIPILGKGNVPKFSDDFAITPKGIDFLQDNSKMEKAKNFLKTLKEIVPGL